MSERYCTTLQTECIPADQSLRKLSPMLRNNGTRRFQKAHKAVRKYIERAFGVLVARFYILEYTCLIWNGADMAVIMKACIILHNMVEEACRDTFESEMGGFDAL